MSSKSITEMFYEPVLISYDKCRRTFDDFAQFDYHIFIIVSGNFDFQEGLDVVSKSLR
jgi:hypothetical protein